MKVIADVFVNRSETVTRAVQPNDVVYDVKTHMMHYVIGTWPYGLALCNSDDWDAETNRPLWPDSVWSTSNVSDFYSITHDGDYTLFTQGDTGIPMVSVTEHVEYKRKELEIGDVFRIAPGAYSYRVLSLTPTPIAQNTQSGQVIRATVHKSRTTEAPMLQWRVMMIAKDAVPMFHTTEVFDA